MALNEGCGEEGDKDPRQGENRSALKDVNQIAWENRSRFFGTSPRGVLFKGLPDAVNEHIHNWHQRVVLETVEQKNELKILDIGCGYGRLSLPVIERFPDANIQGLDISEHYVALYRETTKHPAVVGTVEDIPADLGGFDYILCVTVLMYLDDGKLERAVSNLLLHLKRDGKLILIEPHLSGRLLQTGFGLATLFTSPAKRMQRKAADTGGRYFRAGEMKNHFVRSGGKVLMERRLPMTSFFFLPLTFLGKFLPARVVQGICKLLSLFDDVLSRFKLPSIYVAYLIARE